MFKFILGLLKTDQSLLSDQIILLIRNDYH
jgi:hypothetical protein